MSVSIQDIEIAIFLAASMTVIVVFMLVNHRECKRHHAYMESLEMVQAMTYSVIERKSNVSKKSCRRATMIDDSERQEIAENLRYMAIYGDRQRLSAVWAEFQWFVLGEDDFPKPKEVFAKLADLIDGGAND